MASRYDVGRDWGTPQEEKEYVCHIDQQRFTTEAGLQQHIVTHYPLAILDNLGLDVWPQHCTAVRSTAVEEARHAYFLEVYKDRYHRDLYVAPALHSAWKAGSVKRKHVDDLDAVCELDPVETEKVPKKPRHDAESLPPAAEAVRKEEPTAAQKLGAVLDTESRQRAELKKEAEDAARRVLAEHKEDLYKSSAEADQAFFGRPPKSKPSSVTKMAAAIDGVLTADLGAHRKNAMDALFDEAEKAWNDEDRGRGRRFPEVMHVPQSFTPPPRRRFTTEKGSTC